MQTSNLTPRQYWAEVRSSPNRARVAFWVAPNLEFYELGPAPNPQRKAWPRAIPDIQGYGTRDYGNRVGLFRCPEALDAAGIEPTISVNAAVVERCPQLIERLNQHGRAPQPIRDTPSRPGGLPS